jgi:hypothetical protein
MSDESSPHGVPNQGTPSPANPPPPPAATPPPPAPAPSSTDPTGGVPAAKGATVTLTPGLVLGVVGIIAILIGLLLNESDGEGAPSESLWDRTSAPLWSIVAIVAAVATLLPALRSVVNVPARLAWTIGAVGAGYLVFWWVLFILPEISLNVAFLVTLGVGAAVAAVLTSPDNPYRDEHTSS